MGQKIWVGTDGNYDSVPNWNGGKPSGGTDDVVVPATTIQAIVSGADDENAVDLNTIYVERGHNQDVASSGAPWFVSTDQLIHEGGGTLYFKAGNTKIDLAVINATPVTASGKSASLTGVSAAAAWGNITIVRGIVDIEGVDFTIDRLWVGSIASPATDVTLDLKSADGLITLMFVNGGVVRLNRPVTTLIVCSGRVEIDDYVPVTVHQSGGVVEYKTPSSVGDITEYNLGGGLLDLTRSFVAKGITTLNVFGAPETSRYLEDRYTTIGTLNQFRIAG